MFCKFSRKLWRLCSRIRSLVQRRLKPKVIIKGLGKLAKIHHHHKGKQPYTKCSNNGRNGKVAGELFQRPIRIATFNAALFSLAPVVPRPEKSVAILKQSPPLYDHNVPKTNSKVPFSPPDNEISFSQKNFSSVIENTSNKINCSSNRNLGPVRSPLCFPFGMVGWMNDGSLAGSKTILDVLREVDADVLALQDVKAEEEKNMKPLSDLAAALGMNFVFAESWAPEYGNAILSKWQIKKWRIQKIFDDKDFRNVLKATIDVPWAGELNFHCTQLDHLDENWRMKQVNAIIESNDHPHILAGGLNSLDGSDYTTQRWTTITRYFEEIGKPTPKVEVVNFLKGKNYEDAKNFVGECQQVIGMAEGQNVQGTCKYGTRVDYILASQEMGYKFIPGSYSVISSKGTSDHHIVKVDIIKVFQTKKKLTRKFLKRTKS